MKMIDSILLCNDLLGYNKSNNVRDYATTHGMPPYALLYLLAYLNKNGYDSKILDLSLCRDYIERLKQYLSEKPARLIGFTSDVETRFESWDMAVAAKRHCPGAMIVGGGQAYSALGREVLENIPEVDVVVKGDGEITLLELVQHLDGCGKPLKDIKGIFYRENGVIRENPSRPAHKNLDDFIFDEEELLKSVINPVGTYSLSLRTIDPDFRAYPVSVGRGCPHQCIYCSEPNTVSKRSVPSLIKELKMKTKRYQHNHFIFQTPNFAWDRDYVLQICEAIIAEGLIIKWDIETRVDMDHELLPLMRQAGCTNLCFGLESASPRILKVLRKNVELQLVDSMIARCAKLGIKNKAFMMVSLPDETPEDAEITLNFVRKHKHTLYNFNCNVTVIQPKTRIEHLAKTRGIIPADFSWFDRTFLNRVPEFVMPNMPVWLEHLTPEYIQEFQYQVVLARASNLKLGFLIKRNLKTFFMDWSPDGKKEKIKLIRLLIERFLPKSVTTN